MGTVREHDFSRDCFVVRYLGKAGARDRYLGLVNGRPDDVADAGDATAYAELSGAVSAANANRVTHGTLLAGSYYPAVVYKVERTAEGGFEFWTVVGLGQTGTIPEQPLPVPAAGDCWLDVIAHMHARREHGIAKYGQSVKAHNGRHGLRDAFEELLDGSVYLMQVMREARALGDELRQLVRMLQHGTHAVDAASRLERLLAANSLLREPYDEPRCGTLREAV